MVVCTTTREGRAERWRFINVIAAAAFTFSTISFVATHPATAQVTAKPHATKKVVHSPVRIAKPAPQTDSQEADQLNAKWLADHNTAVEAQAAAAAAAAAPAPAVDQSASNGPSITTHAPVRTAAAPAQAVPQAPAAAAAAPAPVQHGPGEEDKFAVTGMGVPVGTAARVVIPGSMVRVKATSTAAFSTVPGGAGLNSYKEVAQAFSGFGPNGAKVEMVKGQTADGNQRLLYASIGEGKNKQSYWWFAPSNQPEGWFDDNGNRLGGTVLAEPKPDSRISSPFGRRRYYGRITSTAFHNGIDFEGKVGEPIHAAADGVVNHANWYYNYGRTVKITHADNFETLYAHMSRIAPGVAPGTVVHKGDIIGYVGSTGRSTGPHLHFSTIVNGEFVDPAQFLSENGNGKLSADALVAFRHWQQDIRTAAEPVKKASSGPGNTQGLHGGADEWSHSPFAPQGPFAPKAATPTTGHL
ncbi:MAG: M23 family metallopeptidase [Proteobacteria bacterium]|nr:M23 family metallopeptidase [Pseudomonadota bacterium]